MLNIINHKSLVLGIMSGTSMDGLDISCAQYYQKNNIWEFNLIASKTFEYSDSIKSDLLKVFRKELTVLEMDIKFGHIISDYIEIFVKKNNLDINLISSHGHTIFHDPDNGYSHQVGSGSVILERFKIPVVCNFRQQDINLGGQGAPLVPVGDQLLFSQYDSCLNLGGIANISFQIKNVRYAYDICPCNMILNHLASKTGKDFDEFGSISSTGKIDVNLLNQLNKIHYYTLEMPKSLSKEYVDSNFLPIIDQSQLSIQDILATCVEHIAFQIVTAFLKYDISNSLLTGGGTFNNYLLSRISHFHNIDLVIPSGDIINFKESIIFGFLGVLKILNKTNCLSSVTGCSKDHSSGEIYLP